MPPEPDQERLRVPGRPLVIAGAVVAITLCWLAALRLRETSSLPGARFDAAWSTRIDAHHTALRDVIAQLISSIGGPPFGILLVLGVGAVVVHRRGKAAGITLIVAAAASEIDVLLMKWVSARPSPDGGLYLGFLGSFPSGHTANAAVLAVSLGLLTRRLWVWAGGAGWVALMGLDRTYLDAHWVTDTVAGAAAGGAIALLTWSLMQPTIARRRRTALLHPLPLDASIESRNGALPVLAPGEPS